MSTLTVVITAYNRAEDARRAVRSVQAVDTGMDTTIVVVDDGSGPQVAAELDDLVGPAVIVAHQANLGLCAARRHGVALTSSTWLAFLDDDDEWLPGWSDLADLVRAEPADAGLSPGTLVLASGAASLWSPEGRHLRDEPPTVQGALYSDLDAQYLAGTWVVRRDFYDLAGGYLPGLSTAHQSELFIRFGALIRSMGLVTAAASTPVARIERRDSADRLLSNPRLLYDGMRWVLSRHRTAFLEDPAEHANWQGWAATNGALCGEPGAADYAWQAVKTDPDLKRWVRAIAMSMPVRSLVWPRSIVPSGSPSNEAPLEHVATLAAVAGTDDVPGLAPVDALFLPWDYSENPQVASDAQRSPSLSDQGSEGAGAPVRRLVARRIHGAAASVLEIECGSGARLVRGIATRAHRWWGAGQPSVIDGVGQRWGSSAPDGGWINADLSDPSAWGPLFDLQPNLVMCVDVIQRLDEPFEFLEHLRRFAEAGTGIVLSTPDRGRLKGAEPLGPPLDPRNAREWTQAELRLLVESAGLRVDWCRYLPLPVASPAPSEAQRVARRPVPRWQLPARRSRLVVGLAPAVGQRAFASTKSAAR